MKIREIIHSSALGLERRNDLIAEESLLSIEVVWGPKHRRNRTHIADLMRTPGDDSYLALGLMFSLGIISSLKDLLDIAPCPRGLLDSRCNERIILELAAHINFEAYKFSTPHMRHAGCGLCGNTQENLHALALKEDTIMLSKELFTQCERQLKPQQKIFSETGGTHAAALFDVQGRLIKLFEDVGRHNALDKLIGFFLKRELLPLKNHILLMSSRGSFELLQKAHFAQIPIVAVVGAVSSIAVNYAEQAHITLIGFLRGTSFNIYTHPHRIAEIPRS